MPHKKAKQESKQYGDKIDNSAELSMLRLGSILREIAQNEIPVARTENDNQEINRKKVTTKTKIE